MFNEENAGGHSATLDEFLPGVRLHEPTSAEIQRWREGPGVLLRGEGGGTSVSDEVSPGRGLVHAIENEYESEIYRSLGVEADVSAHIKAHRIFDREKNAYQALRQQGVSKKGRHQAGLRGELAQELVRKTNNKLPDALQEDHWRLSIHS